jgi:membrane peptidoglycan carboxypeptidase
VVENGTGQKAHNAITMTVDIDQERLHIPIPAFGKTGTANQFTNSSFVGFIPGTDDKKEGISILEGYVIATYVGFDDNRPMESEHSVIYGSSGALPVWIDTANAIVNSKDYIMKLEPADVAFNSEAVPYVVEQSFHAVPISPDSGLPIDLGNRVADDRYLWVLSDAEIKENKLNIRRIFEPIGGGNDKIPP